MKTLKQLESEIKKHKEKREKQGDIYLDDNIDNFKLKTEIAKERKIAQSLVLKEVLKFIIKVCNKYYGEESIKIREELKQMIQGK